ncbi:hypothetical protein KKF64_02330 [Patescibacteria group bacterium]|nr:hypothetical protein [Patescibacteria group bacterium]
MTQKTKAIIIIITAIILFGLLIATIFDLFPSKEDAPAVSEEPEIVLPDRDEGLPEDKVFDSSNAQEFSDLNPFVAGDDASPLEKEAKELAEFFIERFGTYSSDANFAHIDDMLGFMTISMRNNMQEYKKTAPERDGYYSVISELAGTKTRSFSLASRGASFDIVVNRVEESGGSVDQYIQEVFVSLNQDATGQWKINSVVWGKKL